ncbi:(2Fe-2S)-binding protein [Alkaliphilus serpentinus]|uniref:2Fe-2S iron-sulfur cluster binding domain-containing protein n=1 Tax=Alkaliphilus serpentinus TaxID=1482731 RepID=A0A833HRK8_9FIRM|nr:2Fe-2S iron-sulfur cluster-binding protein [Alkaliphilus serpentinus]KAB3533224.1 2Fe-2S iron-sulfur cluster binding domain-containing protein [Alkaliphilus serpentinus]
MTIKVKINGVTKSFEIQPDDFLIDVLRSNGYLAVKQGCDTGTCGVCTIHLDGKAVLSCVVLAAKADGCEITTIEGVQSEAERIGNYLISEGVDQCGYCSSGTIMSILYLERCIKEPTDEEILHYLNGNLCRCTGYSGQLRAIKRYMEAKKNERG